jgi:hypothetical protein
MVVYSSIHSIDDRINLRCKNAQMAEKYSDWLEWHGYINLALLISSLYSNLSSQDGLALENSHRHHRRVQSYNTFISIRVAQPFPSFLPRWRTK